MGHPEMHRSFLDETRVEGADSLHRRVSDCTFPLLNEERNMRDRLLVLAAATVIACGEPDNDPSQTGTASSAANAGVPASATGLGDLASMSGIEQLDATAYTTSIAEFALYEESHKIRGRLRGTMVNNSSHIITSGELKFKVTVSFDDACDQTIRGSKTLKSLQVSDRNPWRQGEPLDFTISSDDNLAGITGEFPASKVTWEVYAYVEDPLCHKARGILLEFPGSWSAATVGAEATGVAIARQRLRLTSAPDGGSHMETVDEGTPLTLLQVKGRKVRVRTPGGTDGWTSGGYLELTTAESMFQ